METLTAIATSSTFEAHVIPHISLVIVLFWTGIAGLGYCLLRALQEVCRHED